MSQNSPEWIDVSPPNEAETLPPTAAATTITLPPTWWQWGRGALILFAVIWLTEWITTRRMLTQHPVLRVQSSSKDASSSTQLRLAAPTSKPQPALVISVTGRVAKPGVYEFRPRARLRDALQKAGGALPDADLAAINLAAVLIDGQQYNIPSRLAKPSASTSHADITSSGATSSNNRDSTQGADALSDARPRKSAKTAAADVVFPLDLNAATGAELEALPGIGPAMSARIIEYRAQNGGFKSVDDLDDVRGIGPKKMEKLRPLVIVR